MRGTITSLRELTIGALDELFPCTTAEVGMPWSPDSPEAYCPRCGVSVGPGEVTGKGCSRCVGTRPAWHRIVRLGAYHDRLDDRIRAMKFRRDWRQAAWLARRLAERLPAPLDPQRVIVAPVPMYWTRRWWRGYNQATLMARAVARQRNWTMVDVLHRTRHTVPQTALPPSARKSNVRDSFDLAPVDLTGYEVILVDDVKTTGATLTACCRLLRIAGARSIMVAVAAVADPK